MIVRRSITVVLASLFLIVVGGIGVLLVVMKRGCDSARNERNACIGGLCIIRSAKEQYALEYGLTNGSVITWTQIVGLDNYIKQFPLCPSSTTEVRNASQSAADYRLNPIGVNPCCRVAPGEHRLP